MSPQTYVGTPSSQEDLFSPTYSLPQTGPSHTTLGEPDPNLHRIINGDLLRNKTASSGESCRVGGASLGPHPQPSACSHLPTRKHITSPSFSGIHCQGNRGRGPRGAPERRGRRRPGVGTGICRLGRSRLGRASLNPSCHANEVPGRSLPSARLLSLTFYS